MHIVPKLFSVYLYDAEHGWLPPIDNCMLQHAITVAAAHRTDWAGSRVALVPDGMAPEPFLEFALAIA